VNIKQLRYFVAAVEAGNITRAARNVHVAQPALGAQLRELEQELDASLLTRHSRGVVPTEAGKLLYERCKTVLELLEQTRRDIQGLQEHTTAPFRLGVTPSLAMLIGTDLQLLSAQAHPRLALTMVEAPSFALADAVVRQEIDAALAYDVEEQPGISLVPVLREELLFVRAAGASSSRASIDLQTVLSSKLAVGGLRDVARRALARSMGRAPADLHPAFEIQSVAAIRELVLRGEATSVLPVGAVQADVSAGRMDAIRITDASVVMTLQVVSRVNSSTAADRAPPGSRAATAIALRLIAQKSGGYASLVDSPWMEAVLRSEASAVLSEDGTRASHHDA
jgi:LysR family nitrogen assimilation transcriptional regulator